MAPNILGRRDGVEINSSFLVLAGKLSLSKSPSEKFSIHDERFAASRRSMMRIMARRMNAAAVAA